MGQALPRPQSQHRCVGRRALTLPPLAADTLAKTLRSLKVKLWICHFCTPDTSDFTCIPHLAGSEGQPRVTVLHWKVGSERPESRLWDPPTSPPPTEQGRLVITPPWMPFGKGSFSCLHGINVTRGFSLPKSASDTAVLFGATIFNDPAMLLAKSSLIALVKSFAFVKYLLSFKGLVFLVNCGEVAF